MFDKIFEFKMQAKAYNKESAKAAKRQQDTMAKIKKTMAQGNMELAKTYAQEALRHKNEAQRYKVLGSKLESIHSKLQHAYKNQQLQQSINGLMNKMGNIANMNDLTKMVETMDNFEKMVDNIDIQAKMMDDVFDNVNAGTVNEQEVNELMNMLQETDAQRMGEKMVGAGTQQVGIQQQAPQQNIFDFP